MLTNTEKYLKENRSLLDVEYPDDNAIWSLIEKQGIMPKKKSGRKLFLRETKLRKIAASVIIVIALSYIAVDLTIGISVKNENYLSQVNEEYGNIEKDYIQTVKFKKQALDKVNVPDNEIIRSIISELEELDNLYNETSGDLIELGDNHQVVNTIFNIYERKIELLERIIIETNKYENYEKNNESEV